MELKKKKYTQLDYIVTLFKVAPLTTTFLLFLQILVAINPSIIVIVTSFFIDTAISIFEMGVNQNNIYKPLILMMLVVGFSWLSSMLLNFIKLKLSLRMNEKISLMIVKKRHCLEYKHVENNDTWDLIERVSKDPSKYFLDGFFNLLNIGTYIIQIMGLITILAAQIWWVSMIVLIVAIVLFPLSLKCGKEDYEAFSVAQKYFRKANYLKDIISSRENVEERSLFGYNHGINKLWFEWFEKGRVVEYKADRKNFIRMKSASIITAFFSIAICLILLNPVDKGLITVGMYMSLVTASFNLVKKMSWELSVIMQEFTRNSLYLKDLTRFSYLEEVEGSDELPDSNIHNIGFKSIEFKNVHFTYPGTDRRILKGLNMRLEADKQYAFVGKNGSGKTTIIKLLTGLYDKYEGEILIDGINLRDFEPSQLKAFFSIVYQDYAKYQVSLKDNILLGCGKEGDSVENEQKLVEKILDDLQLKHLTDLLPNGIETELGKISDENIDLSGGQWQRVAIGRALASEAPIYILDEPTASIDPVSEARIYQLFEKLSKGKTTLLITHRLGAARIADNILVVNDGVIAESGSHTELINNNGIYASMYEAQRSWYNEKGA